MQRGNALVFPSGWQGEIFLDMVRTGMSLPALMRLMGHADIETTLPYVQVTAQDVDLE